LAKSSWKKTERKILSDRADWLDRVRDAGSNGSPSRPPQTFMVDSPPIAKILPSYLKEQFRSEKQQGRIYRKPRSGDPFMNSVRASSNVAPVFLPNVIVDGDWNSTRVQGVTAAPFWAGNPIILAGVQIKVVGLES